MRDSISITLASAAFWETIEYSAMGAVLVGVIGEIIADFSRISKSEYWKERIGKWSAILLAVALAVELLATVKTNNANEKQIAEVQLEAANLGVSVGNLDQYVKDKSKEFKDAAEKLKLETKDLNVAHDEAIKASQEANKDLVLIDTQLKTLRDMEQKVRDLTTPRTITDAQVSQIGMSLKQFAKTPFDISVTNDPESIDFAVRIALAMKAGDWDWKPWDSGGVITLQLLEDSPAVGTLTLKGFFINILTSDIKSLEKPGLALVEALNANGVKITVLTEVPDAAAAKKGAKSGLIHIVIGTKQ
jgi:hypothetical protein